MAVDASSAVTTGLSLDSVILALFLLALTALGGLVMVFGTNIRKDISKLFEKLDDHVNNDAKGFKEIGRRVDLQAQRLTKLDGRTEDK